MRPTEDAPDIRLIVDAFLDSMREALHPASFKVLPRRSPKCHHGAAPVANQVGRTHHPPCGPTPSSASLRTGKNALLRLPPGAERARPCAAAMCCRKNACCCLAGGSHTDSLVCRRLIRRELLLAVWALGKQLMPCQLKLAPRLLKPLPHKSVPCLSTDTLF